MFGAFALAVRLLLCNMIRHFAIKLLELLLRVFIIHDAFMFGRIGLKRVIDLSDVSVFGYANLAVLQTAVI